MQDKNMCLCPLCAYSVYDGLGEKGWNCTNRKSDNCTFDWDLQVDNIRTCSIFKFAYTGLQKLTEKQLKRLDEKKQTTLMEF